MSKRSEFLRGKSFKYFLDMSPGEFAEMQKSGNEWKLRATVTAMASAVNKRLRAFQRRGITTPATNYITDRYGARISTQDLTKSELTAMYFELKGFGEAETSTVSGWNRVKEKVTERMDKAGIEITDVDYEDYWSAFDEITKMNRNRVKRRVSGASEFDADIKYKILEYVKQKLIQSPDRSGKSIARSLFRKNPDTGKTKLDVLYEEMEADRRATEDKLSAARLL